MEGNAFRPSGARGSRRRRLVAGLTATLAVFGAAGSASGEGSWSVAVAAGSYDIADGLEVVEGGAELRFPAQAYGVVPLAGFMLTEEQSTYAYLGVQRPFPFARRWRVTPGFGAGVYSAGDGKDLGGPLEFRSSLELAVDLAPGSRLGLALYHLSNASLYDKNPGSNSLVFIWSFGLH